LERPEQSGDGPEGEQAPEVANGKPWSAIVQKQRITADLTVTGTTLQASSLSAFQQPDQSGVAGLERPEQSDGGPEGVRPQAE